MPLYGLSPEDIRFARIDANADGDNTVVAAVADKRILVISYAFTADAAGTLTVRSAAGGTVHSVYEFLAAGGGAAFAGDLDSPAWRGTVGQLLNFNCSAGLDINGHIGYVLV